MVCWYPLRTALGVPCTAGDPAIANMSTCCGSKPGLMLHKRDMLRIINPADTVRTNARATSAQISARWNPWRVA